MIGPKIRINGDVSGEENLLVEGQVDGKVSLGQHRLDIGTTGKVNADIEARIVKVDGEVNGDISGSEKVIISSSGNVRGNIVAPRMSLEDGAKFKGSIDMDPGKPAAQPAKPAAEAASANGSRPADTAKSANGQAPVPGKDKSAQEGLSLKAD
ncbi:polymer-forming cytoskeletal protein [Marinihelvus fidelis]|uniref:Polymer-forming cytoskeletal protein n=1 Tax=Marinihelvus fidelis TaxID=2613842 RepID=A0A5N0TG62_9GAMM|nr:polymer-forming cytoskeletal protein [Marinihelvus fidelis]